MALSCLLFFSLQSIRTPYRGIYTTTIFFVQLWRFVCISPFWLPTTRFLLYNIQKIKKKSNVFKKFSRGLFDRSFSPGESPGDDYDQLISCKKISFLNLEILSLFFCKKSINKILVLFKYKNVRFYAFSMYISLAEDLYALIIYVKLELIFTEYYSELIFRTYIQNLYSELIFSCLLLPLKPLLFHHSSLNLN